MGTAQNVRLKRKSTIFVAAETDGSAVPSYSTGIIQISDLDVRFPTDFVQRDILNPSLSTFKGVSTAQYGELTFSVELKGSGTAGTAPRVGALLKACLWSETTRTAIASRTFTSATVAAGTGLGVYTVTGTGFNVTGLYDGRHVSLFQIATGTAYYGIISGTPSATSIGIKVFSDKQCTTPVTGLTGSSVTVTMSCDAEVAYTPHSDNQNSTFATIHVVYGDVLYKMTGAQGTFTLDGSVGAFGKLNFTVSGKLTPNLDKGTLTSIASAGEVVTIAGTDLDTILGVGHQFQFEDSGGTVYYGVVDTVSATSVEGTIYTNRSRTVLVEDDITGDVDTFKDTNIDFSLSALTNAVSLSYESSEPEPFQDVTFKLNDAQDATGANILVATSFSFDNGNTVARRNSISADRGIESFIVSERRPTGSLDPEALPVSSWDTLTKFSNSTEFTLLAIIGDTVGNIVEITAPKVQFSDLSFAERDGILTNQLSLQFNRNAGDDEIVLKFR